MMAEAIPEKGNPATYPRLLRRQSSGFIIVYLIAIFIFPVSSYISEFIGIQSNFLSIVARAITILSVLAYGLFLGINRLFRPVHLFYLFLVFWVFYSIRIIHDTFLFGWQLGRTPSEYFLFAFILCFASSFPFYIPVKVDFKKLDFYIFGVLLLLNLLGIYNNLSADNLFAERLGGNERLNPIIFGMLGGLLVVASFIRLLHQKKQLLSISFSILALLLGLTNLIIAASKSPIIFTIISLVLICFQAVGNRNYRALWLLFSLVVLSTVSIFYLGLQDAFLLAITRFTEISSDQSSYERLDMVLGGLRQFLEEPLLGSFLEEKINKEYPHNLILESFMATGILGGTLFSIFYFSIFWMTIKNMKASGLAMPAFIALSSLIFSMFSGGLSFYVDFWINASVMASMFVWLKSAKTLERR